MVGIDVDHIADDDVFHSVSDSVIHGPQLFAFIFAGSANAWLGARE